MTNLISTQSKKRQFRLILSENNQNSFDKSLHNNILIRLLKALTADEWKEFEKFVGSPFFNSGRNYLPLLKALKKYYPGFNQESFTRQIIYKKLFPGKKFKESVLNSMFSRLYNIGEEYMIHVAIKKNHYMIKERLIIKELRSRGVMLKLNKMIDKNLKYFSEKKIDFTDFKNLLEIKLELLRLYTVNGRLEKIYDTLSDLIRYSTYNYFFDINFYQSSVYSYKNFWKEDYDNNFLSRLYEHIDFEEILKLLTKDDKKNYAPLKLSYLSYMATRYPDNDDYYYEFKKLYQKESKNFESSFKEIILNNLTSLCTIKMIHGKRKFKYEAFEIRKMLIDEGKFFKEDSFIKPGDFRSTFLDALNVDELNWGKNFLDKYIEKLHPDFRSDMTNYCNAYLEYDKKNYDKALYCANIVNINQIIFKLDIKNLIARIYFDTSSTESLLSLLNSYYQLIKNSGSHNPTYLQRHSNFIKYLKKLVNIKLNGKDFSEIKLLKDLVDKDIVTSKSWLSKKIEEELSI